MIRLPVSRPALPVAVLTFAAAAGASAQEVPLYENLGDHHYAITTGVPLTQRYFDQGLRLTYAFNHGEAIRAFEEAARLDPACAMCYWGIALAYGPNINAPMDAEAGRAAFATVTRAVELSEGGDPRERALIEALATRYAEEPPVERAHLDSAYARAMGAVAERFPDDPEAATLYAESLMDLRPWNYWTSDGQPQPGTDEILSRLESVIERNPSHPGACHFYIHAVEAAHPERAVECAERLAALMPGAGHLVHMPAHIYIRVGRWNDAVESNQHAVHADETYIADQRPGGFYPLLYYPHNYHFLSFAASMAGRSTLAIEAAAGVTERVDADVAKEVLELQGLLPYHHLALVNFGRWDEILALPLPGEDLPLAHGLAQYARGVALAATGDAAGARSALEAVGRQHAAVEAEPARTILAVASSALQGEIAARSGDVTAAIPHFRRAVEMEDALGYMEPPHWFYPVRHSLGAALLQNGRAAEAETVYREDLERFPENGWSLYGLALALEAQGRTDEATEVERRLASAWEGADVRLTASRF